MDVKISMNVWIEGEITAILEFFNDTKIIKTKEDIRENTERLKYTIELYEYLNYPSDGFEINPELTEKGYALLETIN